MEAYLDWQKKTSGIKLNDVIEEYRYVANGKEVKKGDFLTYVGEDVAPAIEPPFNAIALSSGVGGTGTEHNEQVKIARLPIEIIKTGNIFPTSWTRISDTEYVADDGAVLTSSGLTSAAGNSIATTEKACDGDITTGWTGEDFSYGSHASWIRIKLPNPTKITKMGTRITNNTAANNQVCVIRGSNDDLEWHDLYTFTGRQTEATVVEAVLDSPDYYQYYKLDIAVTYSSGSTTNNIVVWEWQTSEYVEVI